VDTGLKNKELLKELTTSGSLAINSKNEFGVNLFAEENLKDGVIYGSLVKPKYNESELVKSVDVVITELLPIEIPELPDTVLRSIYNVVTQSVIDLTIEIEELNIEISQLNSKVSTLEAVTESLRIEIDSKDLLIEVANNQLEESNKKISETTIDLSNAIQKGIAESVERISLFARNESLQSTIEALSQEIVSLRDQLFGRQSAIIEGAITSEIFGVKVLNKEIPSENGLVYFARLNANNGYGWLNGPGVEIENFTENEIIIEIAGSTKIINPSQSQSNQTSVRKLLNPISNVIVPPNAKANVSFSIRASEFAINDLRATKDRVFRGNILFKAKNTTTSIEFPIAFRKQRFGEYTGQ
jgi:hypothetical protein